MTKISDKDIVKISNLCKIKVLPEEKNNLINQISKVIDWVEQLNKVNTDNIEPLVNVNQNSIVLNKDRISDGNIAEDILKNAPDAKYEYFAVPKVIITN